MGVEIERKFLMNPHDPFLGSFPIRSKMKLKQGILPTSDPKIFTRIRVCASDKRVGWITIKGPQEGLVRPEFEYVIPRQDAENLLDTLCIDVLEKTRYTFLAGLGEMKWEIDVFHGANEGLVMAEIELQYEGQEVNLIPGIVKEVSDDFRYCNSSLAKDPWPNWNQEDLLHLKHLGQTDG